MNGVLEMGRRRTRETFASRLRDLREARGISKYRLALDSGISKQMLSRLELGQSQPGWETVVALARALGVSVEAFVVEGPAPPRKPKGKTRRPRKDAADPPGVGHPGPAA